MCSPCCRDLPLAMFLRSLEEPDIPRWITLRAELWPHQSHSDLDKEGRAAVAAEPPMVVFIAEEDGALVGFLELGLRSVAEGCTSSPVPYVEGWYVAPDWR